MTEMTFDSEDALSKMRSFIFGFSITRSIAVAAELGIADRLAAGPRTPEELACNCGVLERPLYRMLRALAGEGIFVEDEDGRFGLTPMSDLLRSDHPKSLRDWAIYMADLPYRSSIEMQHSLKTGESAFRKAFGAPVFDYLSSHPEHATKLFRAMSSISAARTAGLLKAYDFSPIARLVDVGGAHGAMVAAIAKRYKDIRCTCFDQPSAQQGALKTFRDSLIDERCDFVGGDFFEDVPAGADAYSFRRSSTIGAMNDACRSSVTVGGASSHRAYFWSSISFYPMKRMCPTPTVISWTWRRLRRQRVAWNVLPLSSEICWPQQASASVASYPRTLLNR